MAHDNEYRLLSKVIVDRNIIPLLEMGVKDDWFIDDDLRRIWTFVRTHYSKYREVPTLTTVVDNFPNFQCLKVEDTIDYLLDAMVTFRRSKLTMEGIHDAISLTSVNDFEGALSELSKTVSLVNEQGQVGTTHVDLTKDPESRLDQYEQVLNHTMLGIPTGFKLIDEATAGLQAGQLVTLIAPAKGGKSMTALSTAINCHKAGKTVLFQSFEMTNQEQTQRHDAIRAHLSNNHLRRGVLDPAELRRYKALLKEMKSYHPFHMVDAIGGMTLDALLAKADQLKPDIIFVDGVYLMFDQMTGEANTPQALTNITRGMKRMAQKLNIPIVITTQTLLWKMKGGKVTADSIGYSSSFFQDSDVILGVEEVPDNDKIRLLKVVQSRNAPPSETSITWGWETGCFHDEADQPTCDFCQPWSVA